MRIIDLNDDVASKVNIPELDGNFAADLSDATPVGTRVGIGDTLEITIWEAAPAALFGTGNLDTGIGSAVEVSRPNTWPGFAVGPSGTISVPFAGDVPAAGHTLSQIEQDIVRRLRGRAHLPQVIVRLTHNVTSTVAVLGNVKQPMQVPLTPHGERILDAIAQAGGTAEPLDRMTIQVTRGGTVERMAARDVLTDARNNIVLRSGDVITVLYQPYSFTVIGAAGKNDEIRFEGVGITLSQALGRVGGLQDDRADPKGVFVFRWEEPALVGRVASGVELGSNHRVPVIYHVDMKQPETYFAAQKFRMRDGDVVYVANSSFSDVQRVLNIIASSILPVATVRNTVR